MSASPPLPAVLLATHGSGSASLVPGSQSGITTPSLNTWMLFRDLPATRVASILNVILNGSLGVAGGAVICTSRPRNTKPDGAAPVTSLSMMRTIPPWEVVTEVSTGSCGVVPSPSVSVVTVSPGLASETATSTGGGSGVGVAVGVGVTVGVAVGVGVGVAVGGSPYPYPWLNNGEAEVEVRPVVRSKITATERSSTSVAEATRFVGANLSRIETI